MATLREVLGLMSGLVQEPILKDAFYYFVERYNGYTIHVKSVVVV